MTARSKQLFFCVFMIVACVFSDARNYADDEKVRCFLNEVARVTSVGTLIYSNIENKRFNINFQIRIFQHQIQEKGSIH